MNKLEGRWCPMCKKSSHALKTCQKGKSKRDSSKNVSNVKDVTFNSDLAFHISDSERRTKTGTKELVDCRAAVNYT